MAEEGHHRSPRQCSARPAGQALAIQVSDEMPIDYAEKLARVLLSKQPSGLFPDYQEFGQTAERRLVIRGLGHDFAEVQKLSGRLHRKFDQAMAIQRIAHRVQVRDVARQMWLQGLVERLDRKPSREDVRRDKRITLALIVLMAVLFCVYAYAQQDRRPKMGFWHCHVLGDAEGPPIVQLASLGAFSYVSIGGEHIFADYQLDGLDRRWALMRQDSDDKKVWHRTGKEIFMQPDGFTVYLDFGYPPKHPGKVSMTFKCVEVDQQTAINWSKNE